MTSERILSARARAMPDKIKKIILRTYVLSLFQYTVWDENKGENTTISPEGIEIAEYLLKEDKWREYRVEVERDLEEWEEVHETYH